jgi:enoyl-CoA hydratase/carnithine racemase
MTFETIQTAVDGPALIITLNRPDKRNAFSKQMMLEVGEACRNAEADEKVRGVIITGGQKQFSSGSDLNEALAIKTTRDCLELLKCWERVNETIEKLDKPVIAAIEGFCFTGGFEFILACDIRVAAEGASFALTSSKIGTVPGAGGTQRLPRLVGIGKALDIMLSAEPIDAAEAYRCGIVERLVPAGQALRTAVDMIKVYEKRAPLSLAYVKRAVRTGVQMDLASAIEFERFLVSAIYATDDRKEGIGAFLEKRAASFRGL